jgi:poly(A) polymerase
LRAVALAARLNFSIEAAVLRAIAAHRHEIAKSSPPRLLEEYYKILRAGASETTFRSLQELGLLEPISAELHRGAADPLWKSLAELDDYRRRFESTPDTLTNTILMGSLLVPLGISLYPPRPKPAAGEVERRHPPLPKLGDLPLARRDVERLRQVITLQRRLRDQAASARAPRALVHRSIFREALTWLEIHGSAPELVAHWKALASEIPIEPGREPAAEGEPPPFRRKRRRRRRGRYRPVPS